MQWAVSMIYAGLKTKVIRMIATIELPAPARGAVIAAALAAFCRATARSAALCAEQESLLDELLRMI